MTDHLYQSGVRQCRVQGKKCSPGLLDRDHSGQQVDTAFGEQDNDIITADSRAKEPAGDLRGPACEFAIAHSNRSGRHCDGVGAARDLTL